jgi:hypothetical protein
MQYRAKSEDCDDNTGEYSTELLEVLEDLFGEDPSPTPDTNST